MRRLVISVFLAICFILGWLLLRGPEPGQDAADIALMDYGGAVFRQHCGPCHSAETTHVAPGLSGLFGRTVGSTSFPSSPALIAADFIWNPDRLDAFLTNPRGYIPGNQMVFYGLDGAAAREALIVYIENL